jgi:SAM-dependent methyltransferase
VSSEFSRQFWPALASWWREQVQEKGAVAAGVGLLRELWGFLRESTPAQRRQRYGDMDYDWQRRVNTTSGSVGWQTRLLGIFHSPYQPTDPALFREMMAALPVNFREFTFIDIGSGKGRTLLLASEYAFRKIIGVELIADLNRIAQENIAAYWSERPAPEAEGSNTGRPPAPIEAFCMDARDFAFPPEPLLVYLFNPLPEAGLRQVVRNLGDSLARVPRPVWIVYHNALLERVLTESSWFVKELERPEFAIFRTVLKNDVQNQALQPMRTIE